MPLSDHAFTGTGAPLPEMTAAADDVELRHATNTHEHLLARAAAQFGDAEREAYARWGTASDAER